MNDAGLRDALLERLRAEAPRFDFFQAVRLLLRSQPAGDQRRRLPSQQPVRFRANTSFLFKASDLQALTPPVAPGEAPHLLVNFLGIASPGVIGSLPHWYAMTALTERAQKNPAMLEFFALFDDRLLQLYFRAWLRNQVPIQYELHRDGPVSRVLYSTVGLGFPGLRRIAGLDPRAFVHLSPMLLRRPVTPAALTDCLTLWFGITFGIEQFVEFSVALEPELRLRLGDHGTRLGSTTVVGDTVRMRQGKFRLVAGPLDWASFAALLPGSDGVAAGSMLRELMALVRQATGIEFEYDMQLILREDAVPTLAFRADEPARARLGLSTWLGTRLQGGHAKETVVRVADLERVAPAAAMAPSR